MRCEATEPHLRPRDLGSSRFEPVILSRFALLKLTLQRNPDSFKDYVSTTPLREIELPNIASAKKNMRKSRAAMARNRAQRSALRTALKKGHSPEVDAAERLSGR